MPRETIEVQQDRPIRPPEPPSTNPKYRVVQYLTQKRFPKYKVQKRCWFYWRTILDVNDKNYAVDFCEKLAEYKSLKVNKPTIIFSI